jgi:hypothetical protein
MKEYVTCWEDHERRGVVLRWFLWFVEDYDCTVREGHSLWSKGCKVSNILAYRTGAKKNQRHILVGYFTIVTISARHMQNANYWKMYNKMSYVEQKFIWISIFLRLHHKFFKTEPTTFYLLQKFLNTAKQVILSKISIFWCYIFVQNLDLAGPSP